MEEKQKCMTNSTSSPITDTKMTQDIGDFLEEAQEDPQTAFRLAEELQMWTEVSTLIADEDPQIHLQQLIGEILNRSNEEVNRKYDQLSEDR